MPSRSPARRHKRPNTKRNNAPVKRRKKNRSSAGSIPFTKMHGLGNDFVVLDCINNNIDISSELVKAMSDRHFGVGCDQLLVVDIPNNPDSDFSYRIFNADGNEVEQCGNGARCFAKYVVDKKLTAKTKISVDTIGGKIVLHIEKDQQVTVDMGLPNFEPASLPMQVDEVLERYRYETDAHAFNFWAVSVGNPHAIIMTDDVKTADVEGIGTTLQQSSLFPESVNVGFLEIDNECLVHLRVFERGVGETLACGTGACAAAVAGIARGYLSSPVTVNLPGGPLTIDWESESSNILMTGPAATVYHGQFNWRPNAN